MQRFKDSITGEPFIGREALIDTMSDIIEGLGGALLFCVLSLVDVKIRKESFIKTSLNIEDNNSKENENLDLKTSEIKDSDRNANPSDDDLE